MQGVYKPMPGNTYSRYALNSAHRVAVVGMKEGVVMQGIEEAPIVGAVALQLFAILQPVADTPYPAQCPVTQSPVDGGVAAPGGGVDCRDGLDKAPNSPCHDLPSSIFSSSAAIFAVSSSVSPCSC